MPDWIAYTALALLALNLLLGLVLLMRRTDDSHNDRSAAHAERLERELRDELGRQGQATRSDLGTFQQLLMTQSSEVARTQNEQIDSFRSQLATTQQAVSTALAQATQGLATQSQGAREAQDGALRRFSETLAEQLRALSEANDRRMAEVRAAVETRLNALQ